jgi:hypothetical protein
MAQLVWRYTPQDTATAHLVYTGSPQPGRNQAGLALISACGLAQVGVIDGWRGVAPKQLAHLRTLRHCPTCVARFPHAAEQAP